MKVFFLSFFALMLGLIGFALLRRTKPPAPSTLTPGIGAQRWHQRHTWPSPENAATLFSNLMRAAGRWLRHYTASKDRFYLAAGRALAT